MAVPPVTARPLNPAWLENRCVPARSAPVPGGAQSSAFPLLARSAARELTPLSPGYCRPGGIRSGNARLVFSRRSFCFYSLRSFSLCEKSRGAGGVQVPSPLGSSQSFSLLPPCSPPFLFTPPPHSSPQLPLLTEATAEAGGRSWLQDIMSRERGCFPFQLFLKQR